MIIRKRPLAAFSVALAAAALVSVGATSVLAKSSKGRADKATIYTAITHTVGNNQIAAGDVTDKILGKGAITYKITVGTGSTPGTFKVSANPVILFTKTGQLLGKVKATLVVNSDGSVTFTKGKFSLTKGSGGQKGHSYTGTFTGSGKSAGGPFVFHEKGTYK